MCVTAYYRTLRSYVTFILATFSVFFIVTFLAFLFMHSSKLYIHTTHFIRYNHLWISKSYATPKNNLFLFLSFCSCARQNARTLTPTRTYTHTLFMTYYSFFSTYCLVNPSRPILEIVWKQELEHERNRSTFDERWINGKVWFRYLCRFIVLADTDYRYLVRRRWNVEEAWMLDVWNLYNDVT